MRKHAKFILGLGEDWNSEAGVDNFPCTVSPNEFGDDRWSEQRGDDRKPG